MLPNGQSTGQGQGVAMLSPVAIGRHCRWTRSPATASLQQLVSGYNCVLALAYLTCANKWLLLWWESRLLQWNVIFFCNSRGLCRVPRARHSAKIFQKKIYNFFAECLAAALGKVFFKKNSEILCRVPKQGHSAKKLFKKNKKNFAECLGWGSQQSKFLKK